MACFSPALAGKCREIFMAAIFAFHAGKAVYKAKISI
jgi:hypothetical protein